MAALVGGIEKFQLGNTGAGIGIQDTTHTVQGMKTMGILDGKTTATVFETEELNTLMHGVGYGKSYALMSDYQNASNMVENGSGADWEKYWNTLNNNVNISDEENSMTISWIPWYGNQLSVTLNGTANHFVQLGFDDFRDNHVYLQSHWGSGVVFTSASFWPDKNYC